MMEFVKELEEARMTRNSSGLEKLSYNDCLDRAYLCFLILEILRHFPVHNSLAKKYARETTSAQGFERFRTNGTDLYNFLYLSTGSDDDLEKLRNPEAAKEERDNTNVPLMQINKYLSKIAHGNSPIGVSELFIKMEREFDIKNSDYKKARRVFTNFEKENRKSIKEAVTKILYAARARLRSSDIIKDLERVSVDRDLEAPGVDDSEPTVTDPDTDLINKEISGNDLVWLQKIVGAKNLRLATEFVKLSNQGKTIPSNVTKAMHPAIEVLVDIIKGGPSHIARLKQLQQLAQKENERKKKSSVNKPKRRRIR